MRALLLWALLATAALAADQDHDGYSPEDGDCDDTDPDTYPGAPEKLDHVDNDCDSLVDEGTSAYDDDGDGYAEDSGDCDDTDPLTYPGAMEWPDGADNDCDGVVDEGTTVYDDDGDGFSEADGDCDDTDPDIWPGAVEIDDGQDDDCDGVSDVYQGWACGAGAPPRGWWLGLLGVVGLGRRRTSGRAPHVRVRTRARG
jgi:MYXO-CTERM domain-containing protein